MAVRAIITGATGMVGEGVLLECLASPDVEQVLVINRKPGGVSHPRLREIVHADLSNIEPLAPQLAGYNACFFCLGVSSVGMDKDDYKRITYDLTLGFAQTLARISLDMTFCYVTGKHTDSTEQGSVAWARVKGATENALLRLFPNGVMFRPAAMLAVPGQKNLKLLYHMLAWIFPIGRALSPANFCTLREVAQAMIKAARSGSPKKVLEVADIVALAKT